MTIIPRAWARSFSITERTDSVQTENTRCAIPVRRRSRRKAFQHAPRPSASKTEGRLQIDAPVGGRIRKGAALQIVWSVKKSRPQNSAGICVIHFVENVACHDAEG